MKRAFLPNGTIQGLDGSLESFSEAEPKLFAVLHRNLVAYEYRKCRGGSTQRILRWRLAVHESRFSFSD